MFWSHILEGGGKFQFTKLYMLAIMSARLEFKVSLRFEIVVCCVGLHNVDRRMLDGGRVWGVLFQITRYFCDRQSYICDNWDQNLMMGAEQEEAEEEADEKGEVSTEEFYKITSAHLSRASDAIANSYFWSAVHLLRSFGAWLGHLENWSQCCSCHPSALRDYFDLPNDCPLRGCRASEMAAGSSCFVPCSSRPRAARPSVRPTEKKKKLF